MSNAIISIIEDDADFANVLYMLLKSVSLPVCIYSSAQEFLRDYSLNTVCIISDIRLPGMSGLQLQAILRRRLINIPIIFISGHADIEISVRAMKSGAIDFFAKPINNQRLLDCVFSVLNASTNEIVNNTAKDQYMQRLTSLTLRERSILNKTISGMSSKAIASDLHVCKNTVDVHRTNLMEKMNVESIGELVSRAVFFSPDEWGRVIA